MQKVQDNYYFDYASTTPVDPEIISDLQKIQSKYFENADALYDGGQRVHDHVRASAHFLAQHFGVLDKEIIFTSGASESNSAALKGIAFASQNKGKHIISSRSEHSSVLSSISQLVDHFGFAVSYVPLNESGSVSLDDVKELVRPDTILISLMAVNNETGAVTDIDEIATWIKKKTSAYFHVDGVQALTKKSFSLQYIDACSFSAHKIYGMKGSGLLILKSHVPYIPLVMGGQQQSGVRGGTIDNAAAMLWGKTLRLAQNKALESQDRIAAFAQQIDSTLKSIEGVKVHSVVQEFPYIINASFQAIGSEIIMNALNQKGICVSAQSTCNSKSKEPSHVLKAMGVKAPWLNNSIRISLSHLTTQKEVDYLCTTLMELEKYEI